MRILVTGGTGSLGSALIRRLLTRPAVDWIGCYSRDELKQAELTEALGTPREFRALLGDVRDETRLLQALDGIDVVVHAAALKRIDVAAYNPFEAVQTNVIGTWNVLQAAMDTAVRQVVTISSDKAVHSCTLYGNTKAVAEALTIQANSYTSMMTRYCAARWGNVASSAAIYT